MTAGICHGPRSLWSYFFIWVSDESPSFRDKNRDAKLGQPPGHWESPHLPNSLVFTAGLVGDRQEVVLLMSSEHVQQWSPTFLAPGTSFSKDSFSMVLVEGWFPDDRSA